VCVLDRTFDDLFIAAQMNVLGGDGNSFILY